MRELFFQFRNIYKAAIRDVVNNTFPKQERPEEEKKQEGADKKASTIKVGQEEQNFGFGAGKASRDAKPTRNISNLVNIPRDEFAEEVENAPLSATKEKKIERKIVNVDKNEAYQEFKNSVGNDLNNAILKNIEDLKQKKEDIKTKTE